MISLILCEILQTENTYTKKMGGYADCFTLKYTYNDADQLNMV